jgi:hypothetical protein
VQTLADAGVDAAIKPPAVSSAAAAIAAPIRRGLLLVILALLGLGSTKTTGPAGSSCCTRGGRYDEARHRASPYQIQKMTIFLSKALCFRYRKSIEDIKDVA